MISIKENLNITKLKNYIFLKDVYCKFTIFDDKTVYQSDPVKRKGPILILDFEFTSKLEYVVTAEVCFFKVDFEYLLIKKF